MGKSRTNNEDAFVAELLDDNTLLAIVIDGVGGYEGGEVAAEMAQTEIPSYLKEFDRGERIELLKQAVVSANNAICDRRQYDTARPNMSCVLTSVLVDMGRKVIDMVHVGDTRLYQYHSGVLRKLSHDHSYVGYCEEIGDLTEEQAMHHPQRNVISRSVGSERHGVSDPDFMEAVEFPLQPNSILLLCSDGLTDLVPSAQIASILDLKVSIEEKTKELIDVANEAGGKDNVTVVLVEYCAAEDPQPQKESESNTEEQEDNLTQNGEKSSGKYNKSTLITVITISSILTLSSTGYALWLHLHQRKALDNEPKTEKIRLESVDKEESMPKSEGDSTFLMNACVSSDTAEVLNF